MASMKKYTSFGEHLRTLRENSGQTLKTVSDQISIDTSLLAKIERSESQHKLLVEINHQLKLL